MANVCLFELAGRVTSASDRNSRREEMEERRNLAELIRPPNGIAACVVTSGCKIHRAEWNAIPLWRGRAACVNTAKWGCIMCVGEERGEGSGDSLSTTRVEWTTNTCISLQCSGNPLQDGTDTEQTALSAHVA